MLIIREEKNGFNLSHGHASDRYQSGSLEGPSTEHLSEIREKVVNAFSLSENENDEKIAEIKERMISQTLTSIMEAERQNDEKILRIVSSIPYCSESASNTGTSRYLIGQMSLDLISQMK